MSEEIALDLRTRRGYRSDQLPYVVWRRHVNVGLGEVHGEKVEDRPQLLFDKHGSPYVWLDVDYFNHNLSKGQQLVGAGNLDFVGPTGQPVQELEEVKPIIQSALGNHKVFEHLNAENERLKRELAEARAAKVQPVAIEPLAIEPLKLDSEAEGSGEKEEDGGRKEADGGAAQAAHRGRRAQA
jgi:hypothetical protein